VWLASSPYVSGLSGRFWTSRREAPCRFRNTDEEERLRALCDAMAAA
jgi:hypothetical protein